MLTVRYVHRLAHVCVHDLTAACGGMDISTNSDYGETCIFSNAKKKQLRLKLYCPEVWLVILIHLHVALQLRRDRQEQAHRAPSERMSRD